MKQPPKKAVRDSNNALFILLFLRISLDKAQMTKWFTVCLLIILFNSPTLVLAQKTDTVTFYNGDRTICEIENLSRGKLLIKTVAMGTISVEWRKVSNIVSTKNFEIVLSDHSSFYGRIDGADSIRNVTLTFGIFTQDVPINDIVTINPIGNKFWQKLDGSLSVGFSFIKGTQNLQFNNSIDVNYRTNKTVHSISYDANLSENPNNSSQKQDAGYRFQYLYKNRIYNAFDLRWERNTELGINTRAITTLSTGYSPIENSSNLLSVELGVAGNREFTTEDSVSNNLEALLGVEYHLFIFANPKIFIDVKSDTYPSFTVKGRIRSNFDASISWEVFSDFTLTLNYWVNYDSSPAEFDKPNYDWGTTTSIGYKF